MNWEEFMKLKNKANFKGNEMVPITLRVPKELKKIITEDMRTLEDIDEKMPLNSYILLMLMMGSGTIQKGEEEFYRSKNNSLDKYIKDQPTRQSKRRK